MTNERGERGWIPKDFVEEVDATATAIVAEPAPLAASPFTKGRSPVKMPPPLAGEPLPPQVLSASLSSLSSSSSSSS